MVHKFVDMVEDKLTKKASGGCRVKELRWWKLEGEYRQMKTREKRSLEQKKKKTVFYTLVCEVSTKMFHVTIGGV